MPISLNVSSRLRHVDKISAFLQMMINRLAFGQFRHADKGNFDAAQDYLHRCDLSLDKYRSTGNAEYLIDAANYALLEFHNPLHPNAHFVSRDSYGSTT